MSKSLFEYRIFPDTRQKMPASAIPRWLRISSLTLYRLITWTVLGAGFAFAVFVLGLRYWILPNIDQHRNRITALRLNALEQQKALGGDLFQIQLEQYRVQEEREIRILELKQRQREEVRQAGESLFDAALAGGGGIRQFALSQALVPARKIAGNVAVELFGGSSGKFQLPGLTGANGAPNFLGRALQGTPFGIDPLKSATDANTVATNANTAALIGVRTGVGAPGVAGGIGGTLQQIIGAGGVLSGQSGTNPLVFHASDTLSGFQNQQRGTRGLELLGIKTQTGPGNLARGVGIGGVLAGSAFGAYSGFSAGGAQGALQGSSSLLGGAAGLLPLLGVSGPAAPIIGGIALALGVGGALLGDPKKKEQERIDKMLDSARYSEASGMNYMTTTTGASLDYNKRGDIRVYNINTTIPVDTMDARSFQENGAKIVQAWETAIKEGQGGGVFDTIREGI